MAGKTTILFWLFLFYSFFGYLLERAFARATQARKQLRKGFLLLPLCPVYGLALLGVGALPPTLREGFFPLLLWGGLVTTGIEYAVHYFYEKILGVYFWDYRFVPGNLHGRVCLPFSLVWGFLTAALFPLVQPRLLALIARIPPALSYAMLLLFTLDALLSLRLLWRYRDSERLSLRAALRGMRGDYFSDESQAESSS